MQEYVTCAICGKEGKDICKHINKEHGLNKSEYMNKYGVDPVSELAHHTRSLSKKGNSNRKGIPHSEETRKHFSESRTGSGNPFYGKSHTEKSKQMISNSTKLAHEKGLYNTVANFKRANLEEYLASPVGAQSAEYRRIAIETYGHKCYECSVEDTWMEVHHIDENRSNNELGNLVVLCRHCHQHVAHVPVRDELGKFAGRKLNPEFYDRITKERSELTD